MSTEFTGLKTWKELIGWYQNFPFRGADPFPTKVTRDNAYFVSDGPDIDGLHATPVTVYISTKTLTTGLFSLAPGDFWKPDNHPNPEPYVILRGTLWVGNPDTGQYHQLDPGDAFVIRAYQFHLGYNFGDETVEILWMIPRETSTEERRANPVYDDHYQNFRDPIVLHRETEHHHQQHNSWAQPGYRLGDIPKSHLDDLLCWPPRDGKSVHHDPDADNVQIVDRRDWLHFVTGKDYDHQFVTSFCFSTNEFQAGRIKIPPGRVTNVIKLPGERVYYPNSETPLIVTLSESGNSLIGHRGNALFVPANMIHQFQNPGHRSVEAFFVSATAPGVTYY